MMWPPGWWWQIHPCLCWQQRWKPLVLSPDCKEPFGKETEVTFGKGDSQQEAGQSDTLLIENRS